MSPDFINLLGILERAGVVQSVTNIFITATSPASPSVPQPFTPAMQIQITDPSTANGVINFDFTTDGTLAQVQSMDSPML